MSHYSYPKTGLVLLVMSAAVAFAPLSNAALAPYSQNFETMTPNQGWPPNDLSADGWKIYGFVWDANPYTGPVNLVRDYGPYNAANGDPGSIQGVATGEGGPAQGDVVLNKYSDYNNTDQVTLYIQAITYQEQTIAVGDIGVWTFTYDAKLGNLEADSSASVYIQTLDPSTFSRTAFAFNDSTNLPIEWGTYRIYFFIDSSMVGDILSFGFSATSTNYNGSAVFYDNLSFGRSDVDGDGRPDGEDNCFPFSNPLQDDTDGDGIGNACDPDFDQSCTVNFLDLGQLKDVFFSSDPNADLTGLNGDPDGVVNFLDLGRMKQLFFADFSNAAQNPSGIANDCALTLTD